ncbi:MAG: hypothetical protein IT282_12675 [Bacteroidetes bacterium]|nr:hypothetical protein [Bacteroidota bacterium]
MTDVDSGLRDIAEIRSIMERSTKFISLSGFAGIGAGTVALAGAWLAWIMFDADNVVLNYRATVADLQPDTHTSIVLLGAVVLLLALGIAWFFSRRVIRKHAEPVNRTVMRHLILSFAVPVLVGAFMSLLIFYRGPLWPVVPAMLLFYGLGLFSAGSFTFGEIRTLGLIEILLGLLAALLPEFGLYFWAAGFGVLHIVYGVLFFRKYRQ